MARRPRRTEMMSVLRRWWGGGGGARGARGRRGLALGLRSRPSGAVLKAGRREVSAFSP